jgi:hypothetical protein
MGRHDNRPNDTQHNDAKPTEEKNETRNIT